MSIMQKVLALGDLGKLSPEEKAEYYQEVCRSLGLNPLTQPFAYISLNGRLRLYALKEASDQLRDTRRITLKITSKEIVEDVYVVEAQATTPDNRTDTDIGAVAIAGLKGESRANAMMKAMCVPLNSEILTRRGFKKYNETILGEDVLAYDIDTSRCRWTPLLDVQVYERASVSCLHTPSNRFQVRCTPDHSWAVTKPEYSPDARGNGSRGPRGQYKNRQPNRLLVKACQLTASHSLILAAHETETEQGPLTPTEAAILGWAITDGTIQERGNFRRIGICQSKEQNFEAIRQLVYTQVGECRENVSPARTRTFPISGKTYDTKPQHWWYLPAKVSRDILGKAGFRSRADLPALVTRLDSLARRAMLQAMDLAEGDKRHQFHNTDRHILDAYQILSALEGMALCAERHTDVCTILRRKLSRGIAGRNLRLDAVDPCPVWCPTTRYGTWVMRQDGHICITGNTKAKRRVTLSICGLGWLDETEIETIPVNAITERIDPTTGEILEPQVQSPSPPAQQPVPPKNGKAVSPITQTPAFRALMAWLHDEQIAEEPFKRFLHESGALPADEQGELHWAALSEVNLKGVLGKKEGCLARFRPFSEMLALLQAEGINMERFRAFLSTIIPTEAGKLLSLATLPQELHAALPGAIHDYRIWEGEDNAVEEMENEEF